MQTRDANRKRQAVPFEVGDLVYLATKNISFPKGFARKLISKYIGPNKVLKDFGNTPFQLVLPSHLKRRGVHNISHSFLLRIHLANDSDDQRFPGRMDTQLGCTPEGDLDREWTVDRILSHSGSGTDSIFEIKCQWESGDIMWLPYYPITHLQAFTDYWELLGQTQVSKLLNGTGHPPLDDSQIFIGHLAPSSPNYHCLPFTALFPFKCSLNSTFKTFCFTLRSLPFVRPTVDFEPLSTMSRQPNEPVATTTPCVTHLPLHAHPLSIRSLIESSDGTPPLAKYHKQHPYTLTSFLLIRSSTSKHAERTTKYYTAHANQ